MSLHLDVNPQIEARFNALARQRGVDQNTLFETMLTVFDKVANKVDIVPKFTAANDPLIARLEAQIASAPTDPDDIREAEEDMNELMRNLNANRRATGERIPFPDIAACTLCPMSIACTLHATGLRPHACTG